MPGRLRRSRRDGVSRASAPGARARRDGGRCVSPRAGAKSGRAQDTGGCSRVDLASRKSLAHTRFAAFVVLEGVIAGLVAIMLISLLHTVQHVAYGYSLHEL